jgi:hypothetical protein
VDGVAVATAGTPVTLFAGTAALTLGDKNDGSDEFDGWIDGVRIIKGTADPYHPLLTDPLDRLYDNRWDTAPLLINFEGIDNDVTYTTDDAVGRTLTFEGTARLDDAEKRRGSTSLWVFNSSDRVIVPDAPDLEIAANADFTVELFVRFSTLQSTFQAIFDARASSSATSIYIGLDTLNRFVFYTIGGTRITGTTASANQWYHVVLERVANIARLYIDGAQVGSDYSISAAIAMSNINLGGDLTANPGGDMNGWIDSVRFHPSRAIYNGEFTVPFEAIGEPLLVLNS